MALLPARPPPPSLPMQAAREPGRVPQVPEFGSRPDTELPEVAHRLRRIDRLPHILGMATAEDREETAVVGVAGVPFLAHEEPSRGPPGRRCQCVASPPQSSIMISPLILETPPIQA